MNEVDLSKSGIYIVVLKNQVPISTYAGDKRREKYGTMVGYGNLKIGKAKVLEKRKLNYIKTFGVENFEFIPVFNCLEIDAIEKSIKSLVKDKRIRGVNNRLLEWLADIEFEELLKIVVNFKP
jgi:hypothetical protein